MTYILRCVNCGWQGQPSDALKAPPMTRGNLTKEGEAENARQNMLYDNIQPLYCPECGWRTLVPTQH